MTSNIMMDIHEIQVKSVIVAKSNSNNVYLTANVPSGYKFLCWVGFGVSGAVDWANSSYNMWETYVRVWTGKTDSASIVGTYLVYR